MTDELEYCPVCREGIKTLLAYQVMATLIVSSCLVKLLHFYLLNTIGNGEIKVYGDEMIHLYVEHWAGITLCRNAMLAGRYKYREFSVDHTANPVMITVGYSAYLL